jgi:hypothetical protein
MEPLISALKERGSCYFDHISSLHNPPPPNPLYPCLLQDLRFSLVRLGLVLVFSIPCSDWLFPLSVICFILPLRINSTNISRTQVPNNIFHVI